MPGAGGDFAVSDWKSQAGQRARRLSGFWVREIGCSPTLTGEAKTATCGCRNEIHQETPHSKTQPSPNARISGMGKWRNVMSKAGNMIAKRATKPRPQVSALGDESALYRRIRDLVIAARQTVARGVDLVQVHTSFEIGRYIVEYEQRGESRAGYGKEVIKGLAERLTSEFGQGFSLSTLKLMRQFFPSVPGPGSQD